MDGTANYVFKVRSVGSDGTLKSSFSCCINNTIGNIEFSYSSGLRPCFALKSDIKIIGGDGTSENPYIMENRKEVTKSDDLPVGAYINYNTGVSSVGTNGVVTCRVLYDASSQYGLQIITDKNISNVKLGGSDWATASASYNNAIQTLNTEAGKYLNTTYAIDARCVGSVPTNQNGTFTNKNSENAGPVQLPFTSSVSGANNMKEADTNYMIDETQMKNLSIWETGEYYWLASRSVSSSHSFYNFFVSRVNTDGLGSNYALCNVFSDGSTYGYSYTYGLRPCFSLKSDIKITGGNGTSGNPYTM